MVFNPDDEPCVVCGREPDECICALAADMPDNFGPELESDYLDWDFYQEEKNNEADGQEDPD